MNTEPKNAKSSPPRGVVYFRNAQEIEEVEKALVKADEKFSSFGRRLILGRAREINKKKR